MRRQIFVGEVPEYTIIDGVVHAVSGDHEWCFSINTFRATIAAANRALDEWSEGHGRVVPIKKRR